MYRGRPSGGLIPGRGQRWQGIAGQVEARRGGSVSASIAIAKQSAAALKKKPWYASLTGLEQQSEFVTAISFDQRQHATAALNQPRGFQLRRGKASGCPSLKTISVGVSIRRGLSPWGLSICTRAGCFWSVQVSESQPMRLRARFVRLSESRHLSAFRQFSVRFRRVIPQCGMTLHARMGRMGRRSGCTVLQLVGCLPVVGFADWCGVGWSVPTKDTMACTTLDSGPEVESDPTRSLPKKNSCFQ